MLEMFHVKHHGLDDWMFHVKPSSARSAAEQMLEELGLAVPEEVLNLCLKHLAWVLAVNETLNLTAITDTNDAVRLHLVDSLAALPEVIGAPGGCLVDVGTGGGFPGIPLAVASGREAILVDSVTKKVAAIDSFLRSESLQTRITTFHGRSEDLALQRPGAAVVVARAVAPLPVLVELAAPLLANGGRLIALKGRLDDDEYERSLSAACRVGLGDPQRREFRLPNGREQRVLVSYSRVGDAEISLPRRPGMAKKRPLA